VTDSSTDIPEEQMLNCPVFDLILQILIPRFGFLDAK